MEGGEIVGFGAGVRGKQEAQRQWLLIQTRPTSTKMAHVSLA